MRYIRFELWQETPILQVYCLEVEWQVNLPLVFRQGQYLHVGRLQGISGFLLGVVLWLSGLGDPYVLRTLKDL